MSSDGDGVSRGRRADTETGRREARRRRSASRDASLSDDGMSSRGGRKDRRPRARHRSKRRHRRRGNSECSSARSSQDDRDRRRSGGNHRRRRDKSDDGETSSTESMRRRAKKRRERDKKRKSEKRKESSFSGECMNADSNTADTALGPQVQSSTDPVDKAPVDTQQRLDERLKEEEKARKRQRMAPMSREQYEAQQSQIRQVYDEATGRMRLIRGTGEILECIVSRSQHAAINRQATRGDGSSFARSIYHAASEKR